MLLSVVDRAGVGVGLARIVSWSVSTSLDSSVSTAAVLVVGLGLDLGDRVAAAVGARRRLSVVPPPTVTVSAPLETRPYEPIVSVPESVSLELSRLGVAVRRASVSVSSSEYEIRVAASRCRSRCRSRCPSRCRSRTIVSVSETCWAQVNVALAAGDDAVGQGLGAGDGQGRSDVAAVRRRSSVVLNVSPSSAVVAAVGVVVGLAVGLGPLVRALVLVVVGVADGLGPAEVVPSLSV